MAVCGVNSTGWRCISAGSVGWRIQIGTIQGPLHSINVDSERYISGVESNYLGMYPHSSKNPEMYPHSKYSGI